MTRDPAGGPLDVRAAVQEHAAWVLAAAGSPDTWAPLAEHYGLRGVGPGPEGARAVAAVVCGWYAPFADAETADWLRQVPDALAAQCKPVSAVGSIFANARRTAALVPWAGMKFETRVTVSCPGCGAAQQRAREFVCRFCGGDLFPRRPTGGASE